MIVKGGRWLLEVRSIPVISDNPRGSSGQVQCCDQSRLVLEDPASWFLGQEEAKPGPRSVGWFCTYTPLEIIVAAGFRPFRILGSYEGSGRAGAYLPFNICPYVRACLESALSGQLDDIAGVVLVHSCNAMTQLASAWRRYASVPVIGEIHIPRDSGPLALASMRLAIKDLIHGLSRIGGTVKRDSLLDAMEAFRDIREKWQVLLDGQQSVLPGLQGSGLVRLGRRLVSAVHPDTVKDTLNTYNAMKRLATGVPARDKDVSDGHERSFSPRFILTGSIISDGILRLLDCTSADIVYDETCSGGRLLGAAPGDEELLASLTDYRSDLDSAIEALSVWYLNRVPCARMKSLDRRIGHVVGLVKRYGASGVISSVLKFCDPYLYEQPPLRQALSKEGISYLAMEHEYGSGVEGRLLTRLEAFTETVKACTV
jgi:benzoyl-CoA reductase/2-hydroxyglutaryl-CoA dehydratase subunit BcrC/BadD/HgdB